MENGHFFQFRSFGELRKDFPVRFALDNRVQGVRVQVFPGNVPREELEKQKAVGKSRVRVSIYLITPNHTGMF